MQGSLDQPPVIVRGRRLRGAILLVVSLLFVGVATATLSSSGSLAPAVFTFVFFGAGAVLGGWMTVVPARLEIGPSGVAQTVLWRRFHYPWSEVHDFRPALIGLRTKTIGFDFLVPRPGRGGLRRLNTAIAGVQATLQPGWEIEPVALANLLNQARERWIAGPAEAADASAPPPVVEGFAGARMGRKTFFIAAGVILAIGVGLSLIPGLGRGGGTVTSLLLIRIYAARLHDFGRSGWWQVPLFVVQLVVLIAVILAGLPQNLAILAAAAIQLGLTAIIGAIPGDPGANRFGPPPGQPTAVARAEVFR